MAELIAKENRDNTPCGTNWTDEFLLRNPEVKTIIGRTIEASRINSATKDVISEFFSAYTRIIERYNIKTHNQWDFNEHGIALGCGINAA
ncbi:hypothetical protein P152DRAFT_427508 [Eremomyces bilateralis CBS 781.70]|uniref:HTH CENPB-type domain-containing protein n=1 Tax=Eremomyces bilateralis CBS 781.70 TaxID=1392243 RepID=A0A6G1GHN3_9PEZI|nr:uncharacterized protein P152DRAFT_427508 [Eremomyces bilateralis CBS 781.70]KAF1817563.1 hypothetical protein P152DRAFT_427508 [Eremomyces bilateralis CBS 781.70]